MIKAVFFDLDGTLLNTLTDLYLCVNYALETNTLPARNIDEVRTFLGNGIPALIHRSVPNGTDAESEKKVFDTFIAYYEKHCSDNTAPYPNINEMLKKLHENGIKIAIVSNKADFAAQKLCEQFFSGLYDFAIGAKENLRKKPERDMIDAALGALGGIKTAEGVYVGDSEVDILTAKNACMPCISVNWGFRSNEDLRSSCASIIVSNPLDIINIIDEIGQKQ